MKLSDYGFTIEIIQSKTLNDAFSSLVKEYNINYTIDGLSVLFETYPDDMFDITVRYNGRFMANYFIDMQMSNVNWHIEGLFDFIKNNNKCKARSLFENL